MKHAELDRAVARVTGETVSTIKRLGFLLADPGDNLDPDSDEHGPYVIDWDELEAQRFADNASWRTHHDLAVA